MESKTYRKKYKDILDLYPKFQWDKERAKQLDRENALPNSNLSSADKELLYAMKVVPGEGCMICDKPMGISFLRGEKTMGISFLRGEKTMGYCWRMTGEFYCSDCTYKGVCMENRDYILMPEPPVQLAEFCEECKLKNPDYKKLSACGPNLYNPLLGDVFSRQICSNCYENSRPFIEFILSVRRLHRNKIIITANLFNDYYSRGDLVSLLKRTAIELNKKYTGLMDWVINCSIIDPFNKRSRLWDKKKVDNKIEAIREDIRNP
jgi:hypothetical protein